MQITKVPRAELEQAAREQYRARYATAKKAEGPRVVNADALVQFSGRARVVEWRSVRYHAPPRLDFPRAVRLLVTANALTELVQCGADASALRRATDIAALLLHDILRPASRIRRLLRCVRKSPFIGADTEHIQGVIGWLLDVPDAGVNAPASGSSITVDMIDNLVHFVRELPAWCGSDGYPLSWAHYVYGTRHLARATAREDLRAAASTRVAQADKSGWQSYESEQRAAAGWN